MRNDSIADAAASYDAVPYISLSVSESHPDRLASIARMFGLFPADVTRCRVLELGCASAGNIVPLAYNLPGSEFVGLDVSSRQVDDARETIAALGLRNIRVECASIADVDDSWGAFDYIICHGVFSWVDAALQDRIFEIVRDRLTPHGVAFVSYNTYPGWHTRESVRHMMRYHAAQFDGPQEQMDQSRALLTFLASAVTRATPYGQVLAQEVERLTRSSDSYLFHEHLERTNTPIYFHQFMERAARHRLQYLSDAVLSEMLTSNLPPETARTLEQISPDILRFEQYMDFVKNRQFRRTLLCHEARSIERGLSPDRLHGLQLSSRAVTKDGAVDLTAGVPVPFTHGDRTATVSSPATKAALSGLVDAWPGAVPFERLCDEALDRAAPFLGGASFDQVRRGLAADLSGAVTYGLIGLHTTAPACTALPSDRPQAHPLAAYQARSASIVVNGHHEMLDLDSLALAVLRLADGRRGRDEILDVIVGQVEAGELEIDINGEVPLTGLPDLRATLADLVEQAVTRLAGHAVLVG